MIKKAKIKQKIKFEDYKNCVESNQFEKEIKYLEKNKLVADSLRENHKEFIKDNRLILKLQQRFKSKKHKMLLKKLTRLYCVLMMIKEYNQSIQ